MKRLAIKGEKKKNNWSGINQDINIRKGGRADRLYSGGWASRTQSLGTFSAHPVPFRKARALRTRP